MNTIMQTETEPEFPVDTGGDALMTGAEVRVITEFIGLRQNDVATLLNVSLRTVRHWLAEKYTVPGGVTRDIARMEDQTADAVETLIRELRATPDPVAVVYRTEEGLWAARPGSSPYPVGWWRMVVARAVQEVDNVEIRHDTTTDPGPNLAP